jgi:hypothetical protein
MPRKRPKDLRPLAPDQWPGRWSRITGLSGSAQGVIARMELRTSSPGATASALRRWPKLVYEPGRPPREKSSAGCGVPGCCSDDADASEVLEAVIRALPRRDAQALRRRMTVLARLQKPVWET